jgi:hypothetical protein
MYPIRRLVLSGKDTNRNMRLFFGPKWEDDVQGVVDIWKVARMDVLLLHKEPWSGKNCRFDYESPTVIPRPANEEEQKKLKQVQALEIKLRGLAL